MSKLHEMARKRREKGEARRATFHPTASGKPAQVYRWWATNGGKAPERENFCHYWRVIAIWAPLLKLRLWGRRHAKPLGIFLAIMAVIGFITLCVEFGSVLVSTLVIVGLVDTVLGLYLGGNAAIELGAAIDETHEAYRELKESHPRIFWGLLATTLPGAIVGFVGLWVLLGITAIVASKLVKRAWRWFTKREVLGELTPFHLSVITALLFELIVPPFFGNWAFLIATGAIVVFAMIITGLGAWADNIKKQRAKEQEELKARLERNKQEVALALLEPVLKLLFEGIHPRAVGDNAKFEDWRDRYIAYVGRSQVYYNDIWQDIVRHGTDLPMLHRYRLSYEQRGRIRDLLQDLWIRSEPGTVQPVVASSSKKRRTRPSWPRRFASGTGDFFALLWQIIVVNKWKICPIVEFDEPAAVKLVK